MILNMENKTNKVLIGPIPKKIHEECLEEIRKDKVCYKLYLTKDEGRVLLEHMKTLPSLVWMILRKADKRGDFKKDEY